MLAKLRLKEYENPYVHVVKKMKHNDNHQIKYTKHIDNGVHQVWVTSLGPMSREWRLLHLMLQMMMMYMECYLSLQGKIPSTRVAFLSMICSQELSLIWANSLSKSGMSLHEMSYRNFHSNRHSFNMTS